MGCCGFPVVGDDETLDGVSVPELHLRFRTVPGNVSVQAPGRRETLAVYTGQKLVYYDWNHRVGVCRRSEGDETGWKTVYASTESGDLVRPRLFRRESGGFPGVPDCICLIPVPGSDDDFDDPDDFIDNDCYIIQGDPPPPVVLRAPVARFNDPDPYVPLQLRRADLRAMGKREGAPSTPPVVRFGVGLHDGNLGYVMGAAVLDGPTVTIPAASTSQIEHRCGTLNHYTFVDTVFGTGVTLQFVSGFRSGYIGPAGAVAYWPDCSWVADAKGARWTLPGSSHHYEYHEFYHDDRPSVHRNDCLDSWEPNLELSDSGTFSCEVFVAAPQNTPRQTVELTANVVHGSHIQELEARDYRLNPPSHSYRSDTYTAISGWYPGFRSFKRSVIYQRLLSQSNSGGPRRLCANYEDLPPYNNSTWVPTSDPLDITNRHFELQFGAAYSGSPWEYSETWSGLTVIYGSSPSS